MARGKGDGSLFKRADGTWVGIIELPPGPNGKRRRRQVTSKNRNEAMRKLRDLQGQVAAGAIPIATTTTVGKWLDYWLSDILPHRNPRPGGERVPPRAAEDRRVAPWGKHLPRFPTLHVAPRRRQSAKFWLPMT